MSPPSLTEKLQAARERLAEDEPPDADPAFVAYFRFRDALTAAGLARGLGEGDDSVRELLALAGTSAVAVFAARGTTTMEVGDVDTGEVERRRDTSLSSPTTLLHGLHSALAGGQRDAVERLAALPPDQYQSDQVSATELLTNTVRALQLAALGRRAEVAELAHEPAQESLDTAPANELTLVAQMQALHAWASDEEVDFEIVAAADRVTWIALGRQDDDPMVLLGLPALGLAALPWEPSGSGP